MVVILNLKIADTSETYLMCPIRFLDIENMVFDTKIECLSPILTEIWQNMKFVTIFGGHFEFQDGRHMWDNFNLSHDVHWY